MTSYLFANKSLTPDGSTIQSFSYMVIIADYFQYKYTSYY